MGDVMPDVDPVGRVLADAASWPLVEAFGAHGAARTPFLLAALADITGGRSLETNLALLEDNARVAGLVAASSATAA